MKKLNLLIILSALLTSLNALAYQYPPEGDEGGEEEVARTF
jgi:hypothetical protein